MVLYKSYGDSVVTRSWHLDAWDSPESYLATYEAPSDIFGPVFQHTSDDIDESGSHVLL